MNVEICPNKIELGQRAATAGAEQIQVAIADRGVAHVIVATGASQFEMLSALVQSPQIDWSKVIFFHLDEYVGMPISHAASFRRYLKERLVDILPRAPKAFHYIDAERDPAAECRRLGELIKQHPIDVAFIGIGENAHLAFNDPPADFVTEEPYLVVSLDEACRRQQFGEGWFPTLEDVPKEAISMSIRQILKSNVIVCSVPDERKAAAVKAAIEGNISPQVPASVLQQHPRATIYLDPPAASHLLKK
ncbi:Glucosamine-6-phosphate deaminase 1 [Anatilimnocola aggregata]|uniref:Glucosamine-6-phosphate deaminase 1 n=1 Tax=Anatilimnocola aggregata TaxID=2528021 RepID=A0A517YCZ4_9BACT|nr:glucosamine-6-phosphate deaminase [Anatilimnocola aggregata]QDU28098.1 Glucosamine-6-phosphate deaminase 1 [Anatilimnocola aggregata]